jgi:hypothetical protein
MPQLPAGTYYSLPTLPPPYSATTSNKLPLELISHLTASKGSPMYAIPTAPINTVAVTRYTNPMLFADIRMPYASGNRIGFNTQMPQGGMVNRPMYARVGGQVKVSSVVAPLVRSQQTSAAGDVDKVHPVHYPQLPKKRPFDPNTLPADGK